MNTLDGLMNALNETLDRGRVVDDESLDNLEEEQNGYSFGPNSSW